MVEEGCFLATVFISSCLGEGRMITWSHPLHSATSQPLNFALRTPHFTLYKSSPMPEINRSALVSYTPAQMYALVRDVERYPEFLDWVRSAQVHREDEHSQLATLEVQLAGLVRRFTTRNTLVPDRKLTMVLDSGPFDN